VTGAYYPKMTTMDKMEFLNRKCRGSFARANFGPNERKTKDMGDIAVKNSSDTRPQKSQLLQSLQLEPPSPE
jgi:hypothetical protein